MDARSAGAAAEEGGAPSSGEGALAAGWRLRVGGGGVEAVPQLPGAAKPQLAAGRRRRPAEARIAQKFARGFLVRFLIERIALRLLLRAARSRSLPRAGALGASPCPLRLPPHVLCFCVMEQLQRPPTALGGRQSSRASSGSRPLRSAVQCAAKPSAASASAVLSRPSAPPPAAPAPAADIPRGETAGADLVLDRISLQARPRRLRGSRRSPPFLTTAPLSVRRRATVT